MTTYGYYGAKKTDTSGYTSKKTEDPSIIGRFRSPTLSLPTSPSSYRTPLIIGAVVVGIGVLGYIIYRQR